MNRPRKDELNIYYVIDTTNVCFPANRRLYLIPRYSTEWNSLLVNDRLPIALVYPPKRFIATAIATICGANMLTTPSEFIEKIFTGPLKDDRPQEIIDYNTIYEKRARNIFTIITGLPVGNVGFVVSQDSYNILGLERLGASPDGIIPKADVTLIDRTILHLGCSLLKIKCSPYRLYETPLASDIIETMVEMYVCGLNWTWLVYWHQDIVRVFLVQFSEKIWAWINHEINEFNEFLDEMKDIANLDYSDFSDSESSHVPRYEKHNRLKQIIINTYKKKRIILPDHFVHGPDQDASASRYELPKTCIMHMVYAHTNTQRTDSLTIEGYVRRSDWPRSEITLIYKNSETFMRDSITSRSILPNEILPQLSPATSMVLSSADPMLAPRDELSISYRIDKNEVWFTARRRLYVRVSNDDLLRLSIGHRDKDVRPPQRFTATTIVSITGFNNKKTQEQIKKELVSVVDPNQPIDIIMDYSTVHEARVRSIFTILTGLPIGDINFVVNSSFEYLGVGPILTVPPAHVRLRDGSLLDISRCSLLKIKCSPYDLQENILAADLIEIMVEMNVCGLEWTWLVYWHQDAVRIFLVQFSDDFNTLVMNTLRIWRTSLHTNVWSADLNWLDYNRKFLVRSGDNQYYIKKDLPTSAIHLVYEQTITKPYTKTLQGYVRHTDWPTSSTINTSIYDDSTSFMRNSITMNGNLPAELVAASAVMSSSFVDPRLPAVPSLQSVVAPSAVMSSSSARPPAVPSLQSVVAPSAVMSSSSVGQQPPVVPLQIVSILPPSTVLRVSNDDFGIPYVTDTREVCFVADRQLYVSTLRYSLNWFRLRVNSLDINVRPPKRFTETIVVSSCGFNPSKPLRQLLQDMFNVEQPPLDNRDTMLEDYDKTYEPRVREIFTIITALPVGTVGFVWDLNRRELGVSPDGIVPNADVTLVDGTLLQLGCSLLEIKCSPIELKKHVVATDLIEVMVKMSVCGMQWTWLVYWHQDTVCIFLVRFSEKIWAWINKQFAYFWSVINQSNTAANIFNTAEKYDSKWLDGIAINEDYFIHGPDDEDWRDTLSFPPKTCTIHTVYTKLGTKYYAKAKGSVDRVDWPISGVNKLDYGGSAVISNMKSIIPRGALLQELMSSPPSVPSLSSVVPSSAVMSSSSTGPRPLAVPSLSSVVPSSAVMSSSSTGPRPLAGPPSLSSVVSSPELIPPVPPLVPIPGAFAAVYRLPTPTPATSKKPRKPRPKQSAGQRPPVVLPSSSVVSSSSSSSSSKRLTIEEEESEAQRRRLGASLSNSNIPMRIGMQYMTIAETKNKY